MPYACPRPIALAVALLALASCGQRSPSSCVPGAVSACACVGLGLVGAQQCAPDGTFGSCACPPAADGGPDDAPGGLDPFDVGQQDRGNGSCDDSDLEPNDSPALATSLDAALQSHPSGVNLYGLIICTPSDVDYYSFTLAATKNVTVAIHCQQSVAPLAASLVDASGATLATATTSASGLQLTALTVAPGLYYLVVTAGTSEAWNYYDFALSLD